MIRTTDERFPWLVLIHGLGVTEKVWYDPLEERMEFISFRTVFKDEKIVIPFAERAGQKYNLASWTQKPYSTIGSESKELKGIVESIPGDNIFFVAHSRGGLIARCAIQRYGLAPKALICLSSPHHGSGFADLVMKRFKAIGCLLPSIRPYAGSIEELRIHGDFIRGLNDPSNLQKEAHVPHYDICGNSISYFSLGFNVGTGRVRYFDAMESVERYFGKWSINEWKHGYGDGFVSVLSARSPLTKDDHFHCLPVNHANILIDNKAWDIVQSILAGQNISS